jgi:pseudaminic acid cytidylyltransferase
MNICVIPARGGSKRIIQKNIKDFNGSPIISYSIKAALKSNCFDRVIVSSDDKEIINISKKYGAEAPFIRPAELSDDYVGIIPVVKHAIEQIEFNKNNVENVCCLFATAPFISPETISNSLTKLKQTNADFCFSISSFPFPIQRALKISQEKRVEMFNPDYYLSRSQDLEKSYHDAGQFYWGKAKAFKDEIPLFSEVSIPYVLESFLVQDIDTEEDWTRAEIMHQVLKIKNLI